MGANHYEAACAAVLNGQLAVIVIRPPWVGTLTFPMAANEDKYALHPDSSVRAETAIGLCISAHELVAKELAE